MREYFKSIFGNEYTKTRLFDATVSGTLPHAFLITGPKGSGKLTLATEICAAMNCEKKNDDAEPLPCGTCNNCRRIREGIFPDIKFLEKSHDKATIGVEETRDFRSDMFFSATEAKYKFYVVKGADLMTSAAQNALLKVLEEPPSNVHIILLATEADKILTTIKSRTQFIQTELFEYERLKSFVLRHSDEARVLNESNPEQFKSVLLSAYGVIGNALALLDGKKIAEESERRDTVLKFLSVMPKKTPFSSLYTATLSLPQKREELRCVLEETITALRDMIAVKLSDDISTLFFTERDAAEATLGTMSVKRLTKIFDIISSALRDIDKNVLIAPLLTDVAVRIKEA